MFNAFKLWFKTVMPASVSDRSDGRHTKLSITEFLKAGQHKLIIFKQRYSLQWPDVLSGLFILCFLLLLFLGWHQNSNVIDLTNLESKNRNLIINRLNEINTQVQQLSTNSADTTTYTSQLAQITDELSAVQKLVNDTAKTTDIQHLSTQLTSIQQDVDNQMGDIKKAVSQTDNKNYLNPDVLPFKVLSIDVLGQQPFISIDYANHISPLAIGDTVAGWRVISADYDTTQVEFKNAQDKYVKVVLQN